MQDLIANTVAKIKQQNIKPQPRWKYLLKRRGLWLAFLAVLMLGALVFSVAFEMLAQLDWDLYRFAKQNSLTYVFSLLPHVWLLLLAVLLLLAFLEIRRTETGYRYSRLKIVLIVAAAVISVGSAFALFGFGNKLNALVASDVPYYGRHMMMTKERQWMQPENGFLAGTIMGVSEQELLLQDLSETQWVIVVSKDTLVRPRVEIKKGELIKIIGVKQGKTTFQANEIRPWNGGGMMSGAGPGGMMNGNGRRNMMLGN